MTFLILILLKSGFLDFIHDQLIVFTVSLNSFKLGKKYQKFPKVESINFWFF